MRCSPGTGLKTFHFPLKNLARYCQCYRYRRGVTVVKPLASKAGLSPFAKNLRGSCSCDWPDPVCSFCRYIWLSDTSPGPMPMVRAIEVISRGERGAGPGVRVHSGVWRAEGPWPPEGSGGGLEWVSAAQWQRPSLAGARCLRKICNFCC
jgi:hypothetical protein